MGSSVNIPKIKQTERDVIGQAVDVLRSGGLVVYPTETCYGLGADATNPEAVIKLLTYKYRHEGKPISIAVSDREMAEEYAAINETAANLYDNYLPGPITVVSEGTGRVAPGIQSEFGTIGVRIPDHPRIREIIKILGKPITATAANVSYRKPPYSIDSLLKDLPQKQQKLIGLIIDAGRLPQREVSTVVDTTLNTTKVLRKGGIAFESEGEPLMKAETSSHEETIDFGSEVMLRHIDILKTQPLIFALGGELGSGKTQFAKGIARQLGISHTVRSPTFTIVQEYPFSKGPLTGLFVHIDTWRLSGEKEFGALSLENYLKKGSVIVIEWADKYFDILPKIAKEHNALLRLVRFERTSEKGRKIFVEQKG